MTHLDGLHLDETDTAALAQALSTFVLVLMRVALSRSQQGPPPPAPPAASTPEPATST